MTLTTIPTLDDTPVFAPFVIIPFAAEMDAGAIFPVLQLFGRLYPALAGMPETVCDRVELDRVTVPAVMLVVWEFDRTEVELFESVTPLLVAVALAVPSLVALPFAVPLPIPKLPALPTPVETADWATAKVGRAMMAANA